MDLQADPLDSLDFSAGDKLSFDERRHVALALIASAVGRINPDDAHMASVKATMYNARRALDVIRRCEQGYDTMRDTASYLHMMSYCDPDDGNVSGWIMTHALRAAATIFSV